MKQQSNKTFATNLPLTLKPPIITNEFSQKWWIYLFFLAGSVFVGMAVIVSTHYIDNAKLLIGLIGGLAFVVFTLKWPEFSILFLVGLLSGLISLTWLPLLHLGPISLNISDIILIGLLGLVFLRVTAIRGYKFYGSPLLLPLFLFLAAILISAANAILIHGVGFNSVFRTVRTLGLWLIFIPTLELIRDKKALKRFLIGLSIFTVILIIGVLFPNKFEPFLPIEERIAATGSTVYSDFTRVYFAGDMILYSMIPVSITSLALIKKGKPIWRIILLGFLLFWVYKTLFRQYWLTLFVVSLLLLIFLSVQERMRLIKRLLPILFFVLIIFFVLFSLQISHIERFSYIFTDRVSSLLQNPFKRESSLHWRIIETDYAIRKIKNHPIFGVGLANSYRPPMESEASSMYTGWASRYIENGYLYIATFMGLIALIPFFWMCLVFLFRIFKYHKLIQDELLRSYYLGFGLAFLGMMACNIASPTLVFGTRLVFFPFLMGVNEVILRCELQKNSTSHTN